MSLLSQLATGRRALNERQTVSILDALPADIQRDIGWSPRRASVVSTAFRSPFWSIMR